MGPEKGKKMKKVMKKVGKITVIVVLVLSLGIIFIGPAISGTSISAVATCHVPYLITLSDGTKVASESEESNKEIELIPQPSENTQSYIAEEKPNLIQQQEEVTSEDSAQVKLITTVCAK